MGNKMGNKWWCGREATSGALILWLNISVRLTVDDLEKALAQLMAAVRQLPPGQQRQDALKEIGRLRGRVHELLERSAHASATPAHH